IGLFLGFYLIETHFTLYYCLTGMVLWAVAIHLALPLFRPLPGIAVFSKTDLQNIKGARDWNWSLVFLAGVGVFAALAACDHFIQHGLWFPLLIGLIALGGLFYVLEIHCSDFWAQPSGSNPQSGWSWPETLIVLVASFFLFHHWNQ